MAGVLGVSLALTFGLHRMFRTGEEREVHRRAAGVTRDQVERLQVSMLRSIEVLHSIAALYAVQGDITREQFRTFVAPALARQPELKALSWNPRVLGAEREAFEERARRDHPGYAIREQQDGQFRVAGARPEYVPVLHIEPPGPNSLALGFDLESDSLRRGSIDQARQSGQPAATAPLHLAQDPGDQSGLLVLRPVFRSTVGGTPGGESNALAGFAVAVFGISDLVGGAVRELQAVGIRSALYDDAPRPARLHGDSGLAPDAGETQQTTLEFAGRRWRLVFTPTRAFADAQAPHQSAWVLAGGVAFSVLLTAYLAGAWRRSRETARANAALQEEVRVRQKAEAAAAAANQAKSDFLASMSHEIRTPLNAILGYAQLMSRDRRLPPEQLDAVQGIRTGGQHLLGLINEILDLSKIEAGRMELNPVEFDLQALVRSLASTFLPLCAQKRIGFRVKAVSGGPLWVRGDEGKLRQVLINLLGNAVKFTGRGEVYLQYRSVGGGRWQFEVIDTGLGIPEAEQARVFEPFHQGRGAQCQGGTGLGLVIARRQVELLGGTLEFQSAEGIGTRFHFTLPLPDSAGAPRSAPPEWQRLAPGQQVRALVVDDRDDNRAVLGGLLSGLGCEVRTVPDGPAALALLGEWTPDIVFLDWLLPGSSGAEVARRFRELHPSLPVVVHTASALPIHETEARALGCVDFLSKPIRSQRLAECLARHLGVRLETEAEPVEIPEPPRVLPDRIPVPEDLLARLTVAAELHSTTALKAALGEVRELGPDGEALAGEIRELMRSFDMNGILRKLTECTVVARAADPIRR